MQSCSIFYQIPDSDPWLSNDRMDRYIINGAFIETFKGHPLPWDGYKPRRAPEAPPVQEDGGFMGLIRKILG